jgi:hypothetical protein
LSEFRDVFRLYCDELKVIYFTYLKSAQYTQSIVLGIKRDTKVVKSLCIVEGQRKQEPKLLYSKVKSAKCQKRDISQMFQGLRGERVLIRREVRWKWETRDWWYLNMGGMPVSVGENHRQDLW